VTKEHFSFVGICHLMIFKLNIKPTYRVNCITNLPSIFMRLTGICDYLYQTNIHNFTALLYFCPPACYLTLLVSCSLTSNLEISGNVGYKSDFIFRCSKIPLVLRQLGAICKDFIGFLVCSIIKLLMGSHHFSYFFNTLFNTKFEKFNTITYLPFSKFLTMKLNFTH